LGKGRGKDKSELEYLRGQIRGLTSENRHLKRRIKQLEKTEHWFESIASEDPQSVQVHEEIESCQACGKGKLELLDLKHIFITTCNNCQDRIRYRKDGSKIEIKEASNSKAKRSK
jgi:hypothetical protein